MRLNTTLFNMLKDNNEISLNKKFSHDVMKAIESLNIKNRRVSSPYYKPSSMRCKRSMYYTRLQAPMDDQASSYNAISMADTGTRRHVAIQTVLEAMPELGFDWRYLDVEEYINNKHKENKCLDVEVIDKRGMETHLIHKVFNLSFMCDGIIEQISTKKKFLFEFKNQASFKFEGKEKVDEEHLTQVTTYCLALDLEDVFVLYENRNTCELNCPEILHITEEMKHKIVDLLLEVESNVTHNILPDKTLNLKECRWCHYKTICGKDSYGRF